MPVVETVAVQHDGEKALLRRHRRHAAAAGGRTRNRWRPSTPSASKKPSAKCAASWPPSATTPATRGNLTEKIDDVVLHPVFGPIILAVLMFLIFQAVFSWAATPMEMITDGVGHLGAVLTANMPDGHAEQPAGRRHHRRRRQRAGVPAADPDPVLLHPGAGRLRLPAARGLPAGPPDGRRGPVRAAPSFRCCRALPAPFPASWRRAPSRIRATAWSPS